MASTLSQGQNKTGFEKFINSISTYIRKVRFKLDDIIYGKNVLQGDKLANGVEKAIDKGVLNVLKDLSTIDFCNILNYLFNRKIGSSKFDPSKPPGENASNFEIRKWNVQKLAFDAQSKIDKYYKLTAGVNTQGSLLNLLTSLNESLNALLDEENGLNNKDLKKNYPEIDLIVNFLRNAFSKLNIYSSNGIIPTEEITNVVNVINKIRAFLSAIQALNQPSNLLAVADSFVGGSIQSKISELNKNIINPEKLLPLIYRLNKNCVNINNVVRTILAQITKARAIITLATVLLRVYNVISAYILVMPIPNIGTNVGITTKFAKFENRLQKGFEVKLVNALVAVNDLLNSIYQLVTRLSVVLEALIQYLNTIALNIEGCYPELSKELKNTADDFAKTKTEFDTFINTVNSSTEKINETVQGYTIRIVSEQLVDEGITLQRRYGIAIASDGSIVVQSTPTFATLDEIIINEVKLLLASKNLIKTGVSGLSNNAIAVIVESSKYLEDEDISDPSNFGLSLDPQEDSIGLQNFVDNLPGGSALRSRVRSRMISNNEKLGADLKNTDPNSKYSSGLIKQTQESTIKIKIEELEEQKKKLQAQIAVAATNPTTAAIIIRGLLEKIRQIDIQLESLKKG